MLRVLLGLCIVAPLNADTVFLYNGTAIDGVIKARHEDAIELQIGHYGRIFIELEAIESIEKNDRDGTAQSSSLSLERKREEATSVKEVVKKEKEEEEVEPEKAKEASGRHYFKKEDVTDPELRKKIEGLVYDLKRQRRRYRVRAERKLIAIGEPVVPFLLDVSKHENHLVRMAVLRIFKKVGNEAVIPVTIDRLEDENTFVRQHAAEVLREITGRNFGFRASASPRRRKKAVLAWRKWYDDEQAGKAEEVPEERTLPEPVRKTSKASAEGGKSPGRPVNAVR